MTSREMLLRWRSGINEVLGGFFATGVTTSAGATDGSTFISTSLSTIADDALNGMEIYISDGVNAGLRREIVDWVKLSSTGTLLENFPYQIASGVNFIIGEKGVFSDQEGLAWLNDGATEIVNRLTNKALHDYLKNGNTAGTAGGSGYGTAATPTDLAKIPFSVRLGSNPARIYDFQEQESFDNDPWIANKVLWDGSDLIRYKPDSSLTVYWKYAKKPTTITITVDCDLPDRTHPAVVEYAKWQAFMKKGVLAAADRVMRNFETMIAFLNSGPQEQVTQMGAPK